MADKKFAAFPQFLGIDPPVCARILVKCCVPTAERGNCVCALGLNHTEKYTAERLTVVHFTLFMRNQVGLLYFRQVRVTVVKKLRLQPLSVPIKLKYNLSNRF